MKTEDKSISNGEEYSEAQGKSASQKESQMLSAAEVREVASQWKISSDCPCESCQSLTLGAQMLEALAKVIEWCEETACLYHEFATGEENGYECAKDEVRAIIEEKP